MSKIDQFKEELTTGYTFKGDSITLGGAKYEGEGVPGIHVKVPLKTLNRHGLIAGATGTGKTKTLQVIAEQLSEKGIPSVLMDIKGDLSGLAAPGTMNDFIDKRHKAMDLPYEPKAMPVELMTLSEGKGTRLKATVTEFGPVLLSKILGLNDTQGSVISLVFMYCDNNKLPLIDLKDLRKTLQYLMDEGKEELEKEYGTISSSTVGIIMRKVIELEQQGAEQFFGERSFDPQDLIRVDKNGKGIISIIRLMDIQGKPKLFSTFMLSLMAEIYNTFPEEGDSDKPKLCIFIDEAHLVFEEASSALMDQLEVIIKLIRSKGVGIFFCTQNPIDVPDSILSQLGLKVQHALRAFTEKDRTAIKKAAQNYPITEFYKTDEIITQMGTGEALVSALNEKGVPTPLAVTICRAPLTRMDVLEESEVDELVKNSFIAAKYNEEIDRESAYEILSKKIDKAASVEQQEKKNSDQDKELAELQKAEAKRNAERQKEIERLKKIQVREDKAKAAENEKLWKDITRGATRKTKDNSLFGVLARGILGVLGVK
jgi:DNA helicase HerA-like ATPase|tara:strand:+ start:787 stop:2409 length:1623 start_codon:yes stop_codon:yes gene_type:complete